MRLRRRPTRRPARRSSCRCSWPRGSTSSGPSSSGCSGRSPSPARGCRWTCSRSLTEVPAGRARRTARRALRRRCPARGRASRPGTWFAFATGSCGRRRSRASWSRVGPSCTAISLQLLAERPGAAAPEDLARHYELAGEHRAGRARGGSRPGAWRPPAAPNAEAIKLFRRSLAALAGLPEGDDEGRRRARRAARARHRALDARGLHVAGRRALRSSARWRWASASATAPRSSPPCGAPRRTGSSSASTASTPRWSSAWCASPRSRTTPASASRRPSSSATGGCIWGISSGRGGARARDPAPRARADRRSPRGLRHRVPLDSLGRSLVPGRGGGEPGGGGARR